MRACFCKSNAIPSIGQLARTDGLGIAHLISWEGRQGHGNNGVTTIHRFQCGGLGTSFGELYTIPSIRQLAGTDGLDIAHLIGREGCQGHGDDRVAVIHCRQCDGLCTCLGEHNAIPSVRQLAGTDGLSIAHLIGREGCQGHGDDRVAVVHCRQCDGLSASLGELYAIPSVRQLAGTDGAGVCFGVDRINSQSHGNERVASIDGLQRGSLCASFSELYTIPCIRQFAGADGLLIIHLIHRVHCQVQGHNTVATFGRTSVEHILITDGSRLENSIAPCVRQLAGADNGTFSLCIYRTHRHIPNNDAVAAGSRGQCISISTFFSKFNSIKIKAATFTEGHIQTGNRRNMLHNLIQVKALLK